MLLRRYNPLHFDCNIQVPNAKQKAKNAANKLGRPICCLPIVCYNLSILTGGLPGSGFTFTINGGDPYSIAACLINGGTILTKCYTNPLLSGGNPNSTPFYYIDGSNPNAVALCYINGGTLTTKCYTDPLLSGGSPNSTPFYYIDGSNPNAVAFCYINGGYI